MVAVAAQSLDALDIVSAQGTQTLTQFGARATLLGKGGAGAVYAHPGLRGQALKIYATTERADSHAAKVAAMLKAPPREVRTRLGAIQIAWPNARVLHRGRFAGLVMPQVDFGQAWTLQQVIQPTQRKRRGVPERMDLRLYAGRNLASVLRSLHEVGHYVVDLKPQNVLVYRDDAGRNAAHIVLIDCDGFQIREPGGSRFDAELATPQFLHPDLAMQVGDEASFDARRLNDKAELQDDFALAVIVFQLLNDGLHPMAGVETGIGPVPSDLAARLQAGGRYYPYALGRTNPNLRPDPDSLHEWFSPELRSLFDAAFDGGSQPPKPQAWVDLLTRLSDAGQRCPVSEDHWMLGARCGFCAREALSLAKRSSVQVPLPARAVPAPAPLLLTVPLSSLTAGWRPAPSLAPARRRSFKGRALGHAAIMAGLLVLFDKSPPIHDVLHGSQLADVVAETARFIESVVIALKSSSRPSPASAPQRPAPASPTAGLPPPPDRPWDPNVLTAASEQKALEFVGEFFRQSSGPSAAALSLGDRIYGQQVRYYGTTLSKAEVMSRKLDFTSRWPVRTYALDEKSITVKCVSNLCNITGLVDYRLRNDATGTGSSGQASFELYTIIFDSGPVVTGEDGHAIAAK